MTYERRLSELLGTGTIGEYAINFEGREYVVAVPLLLRPWEHWRLELAAGVEFDGGDNEALLRVGACYEWEFRGWSLSLELNFDCVDDNITTVLGASFSFHFR